MYHKVFSAQRGGSYSFPWCRAICSRPPPSGINNERSLYAILKTFVKNSNVVGLNKQVYSHTIGKITYKPTILKAIDGYTTLTEKSVSEDSVPFCAS